MSRHCSTPCMHNDASVGTQKQLPVDEGVTIIVNCKATNAVSGIGVDRTFPRLLSPGRYNCASASITREGSPRGNTDVQQQMTLSCTTAACAVYNNVIEVCLSACTLKHSWSTASPASSMAKQPPQTLAMLLLPLLSVMLLSTRTV